MDIVYNQVLINQIYDIFSILDNQVKNFILLYKIIIIYR